MTVALYTDSEAAVAGCIVLASLEDSTYVNVACVTPIRMPETRFVRRSQHVLGCRRDDSKLAYSRALWTDV